MTTMQRTTARRRWGAWGLYGLSLVSMVLCVGCGRPQGELFERLETPLVWPKPPDEPKIGYVGEISTEKDLKRGVSWAQALGELIFGKKKIGVLISPYAVALDEQRLLVADGSGGVVHIFNLATRDYAQLSSISDDETLRMPVALTVIESNIYVVDSVLHKICVFDREGAFKFSFGAELLQRPAGIAYGRADEKIYVSDAAAHTIYVFDRKGKLEYTTGSRGPEAGKFNFPTHLWVDGSGRLYVSDTLNYRIQVFSGDGKFLLMFGEQGDRPGYFAHPCGVVTDSLGHIYVTDRQFENIQVFDSDGKILMALGEEGSEPGEFWLPAGMYVDDRNRIYVADSFNKRVQIFELLGESEQ